MAIDYTGYLDFDVPASGDLSTKQYLFMTIDSNGKAAQTTLGGDAAAVLQNAPAAAGRAAKLRSFGVSKVVYGGNVTAGNRVVPDNNGKAVAAGSADAYNVGIALVTGVSGDVGTVLLRPIGLP